MGDLAVCDLGHRHSSPETAARCNALTRDDVPDEHENRPPQAPVAGADPRADGWVKWRELAGLLERGCDSADAGDEWPSFAPGTLRTVATALRAAAEAVTERDGRAGWLASLVIERLGGTPDVPAWVAQSAENYQRLTRERDEAERMGHDAVEWIGVVRDLLVDAGYQPGDRDVALANLRTLVAAAARGAEGERGDG